MVRRWLASAVIAGGCLLAFGSDVGAGDGVEVKSITCPETAQRNRTIMANVTFSNFDTAQDAIVTRGALGMHLGNVTLVGPLAFSFPEVTVPRATGGAPECPWCVTPGSAALNVPVRIPPQARPGTFISVGLAFFGKKASDPQGTRREIGGEACLIEICIGSTCQPLP